ncbi:FAD:protein FMN transferase [Patescibacteria group bacterium]|nr:FAD:protein FMN transferase [Patescibacteria group bacterium]
MKDTRLLMGMPITVEIADPESTLDSLSEVFAYFHYVDEKFSLYKNTSEIAQINHRKLPESQYSPDMKTVFALCEETKKLTDGFFDIKHSGRLDPSGLVKGWAIHNAAQKLRHHGYRHFYVEAGGDIEVAGLSSRHQPWQIGIRNPFNIRQIVKVVALTNGGIATSGTYFRGQHVYNPKKFHRPITDILSLTVIGPDIYEADRFATAAFAMGRPGIEFIESLPGFEGYQIDNQGVATFTTAFNRYLSDAKDY